MKNPSSDLPRDLKYQVGLMEKQIKRVGELARFLPFTDQQEEMNKLVKNLTAEAALLKSLASFFGAESPFQVTSDTGS